MEAVRTTKSLGPWKPWRLVVPTLPRLDLMIVRSGCAILTALLTFVVNNIEELWDDIINNVINMMETRPLRQPHTSDVKTHTLK